MTKTLERWWTPAGRVPVGHLLRRGPDPDKDLGLALFAIHKAGAEACELVAKTAVADEMVLATALAETRKAVAAPAVHVISKAVESPTYAGLLLADLLDDAESTALSLYRSCLAKSVTPTLAAQRVGMVYGVPARELAKYSRLATDPKTSPVVLQDEADRALFGYVAKVVAEEYVPAKETVSKAPVRERDWHGKDPGERDPDSGEFQRVGVRERTAPKTQVGDGGADAKIDLQRLFDEASEPKPVAAPPEVARQTRQVRQLRQIRQVRQAPTKETVRQELGQQQLSQSFGNTLLGQELTAQEAQLQDFTFRQSGPPPPLSGRPRTAPDVLKTRDTGLHDLEGALPESASFILTTAEFLELTRGAKDNPDGSHTLRLGGLVEYAGRPRHYKGPHNTEHEHHRTGLEHVTDMTIAGPDFIGQPNLVIGEVDGDELLAGDGNSYDELIDAAKQKFLQEKIRELKLTGVNWVQEMQHVQDAPDQHRKGVVKLIWRPPSRSMTGQPRPERPVLSLVEVVLPAGEVRGGVDLHGDIHVDMNAPVRVKNIFDRRTGMEPPPMMNDKAYLVRKKFWDEELQAIRYIVVLRQAPDDIGKRLFGKAMTATQFRQHERAGRIRRDPESGEFVDLQALFDEAKARHSTPEVRQTRATRSLREVRQAHVRESSPSGKQTLGQQRVDQDLQQAIQANTDKQQLARQETKAKKPPVSAGDPTTYLDDHIEYAQPPPAVLDKILSSSGHTGFLEDAVSVDLSPEGRFLLAQLGRKAGPRTENDIMTAAQQMWFKQLGKKTVEDALKMVPTPGSERQLGSQVLSSIEELEDLSKHLVSLYEANPEITMVRVVMEDQKDGRVRVTLTGNKEVLPVMHVVSMEEVPNPEDVDTLTASGIYRLHHEWSIHYMLTQTWYGRERFGMPAMDVISNPRVKYWLAEVANR